MILVQTHTHTHTHPFLFSFFFQLPKCLADMFFRPAERIAPAPKMTWHTLELNNYIILLSVFYTYHKHTPPSFLLPLTILLIFA